MAAVTVTRRFSKNRFLCFSIALLHLGILRDSCPAGWSIMGPPDKAYSNLKSIQLHSPSAGSHSKRSFFWEGIWSNSMDPFFAAFRLFHPAFFTAFRRSRPNAVLESLCGFLFRDFPWERVRERFSGEELPREYSSKCSGGNHAFAIFPWKESTDTLLRNLEQKLCFGKMPLERFLRNSRSPSASEFTKNNFGKGIQKRTVVFCGWEGVRPGRPLKGNRRLIRLDLKRSSQNICLVWDDRTSCDEASSFRVRLPKGNGSIYHGIVPFVITRITRLPFNRQRLWRNSSYLVF